MSCEPGNLRERSPPHGESTRAERNDKKASPPRRLRVDGPAARVYTYAHYSAPLAFVRVANFGHRYNDTKRSAMHPVHTSFGGPIRYIEVPRFKTRLFDTLLRAAPCRIWAIFRSSLRPQVDEPADVVRTLGHTALPRRTPRLPVRTKRSPREELLSDWG